MRRYPDELSLAIPPLGQIAPQETAMRHLTAVMTVFLLTASMAWATTTAPTPAPGASSPPAGAPAATGGGIGDYWWLIVVVLLAALAIWYFTRRNKGGV